MLSMRVGCVCVFMHMYASHLSGAGPGWLLLIPCAPQHMLTPTKDLTPIEEEESSFPVQAASLA